MPSSAEGWWPLATCGFFVAEEEELDLEVDGRMDGKLIYKADSHRQQYFVCHN
jgi:hypothetical protein